MELKLTEIDAAINKLNGRAAEHTYSPDCVRALAERAEVKLDRLGIPKAMRAGAILMARSGKALPNAYRFSRRVTYVEMIRNTQGWLLYTAKAQTAYREAWPMRLVLTQKQHNKALANWHKEQNIVVV